MVKAHLIHLSPGLKDQITEHLPKSASLSGTEAQHFLHNA